MALTCVKGKPECSGCGDCHGNNGASCENCGGQINLYTIDGHELCSDCLDKYIVEQTDWEELYLNNKEFFHKMLEVEKN